MPLSFLTELLHALPPGRLYTDRAALKTFESDGLTAFKVRPEGVVIAQTQADVIATVKLCQRARRAVCGAGERDEPLGGSLPVAGGVVIALNRLTASLSSSPRRAAASSNRAC
jgi:glycolate oxidase